MGSWVVRRLAISSIAWLGGDDDCRKSAELRYALTAELLRYVRDACSENASDGKVFLCWLQFATCPCDSRRAIRCSTTSFGVEHPLGGIRHADY